MRRYRTSMLQDDITVESHITVRKKKVYRLKVNHTGAFSWYLVCQTPWEYEFDIPLLVICHHSHVNLVKVEIRFHFECNLCFPVHSLGCCKCVELMHQVFTQFLGSLDVWGRAMKTALEFNSLFCALTIRFKIEVTTWLESIFPWCWCVLALWVLEFSGLLITFNNRKVGVSCENLSSAF